MQAILRDFQDELDRQSEAAIAAGARYTMIVSPTGSGKTVLMAHKIKRWNVPTCAMVHRQELVSQIALALNQNEVPHGIIAPPKVRTAIIKAEMETHGRSFYSADAPVKVASTLSLDGYLKDNQRWADQVGLVLTDEGHHVLRENSFGQAIARFRNAVGFLFTAHAHRADGAGLGRTADGVVDALVIGPSGRALINRGYLTDYRVICPPSDIDLGGVKVGDGGELNMEMTRERVHASKTIVGDVVKHYKRVADGELGITFAVDVKASYEIAAKYNDAGIPAAVIEAKTSNRVQLMKDFRARKILQLVNFDCLGEGVDVPACVVVSMVRPTASFQLCAQQFGRMLRVMVGDAHAIMWHLYTDAERLAAIASSSKPRGILIDHVGNIAIAGGIGRHGLPDRPRVYSLERRERKSKPAEDEIPLRVCTNIGWSAPDWELGPCDPTKACLEPYESVLGKCPHCGMPRPAPKLRGSPEHVEGDLIELSPETLAELRGDIQKVDDAPRYPMGADAMVHAAIKRRHFEKQTAQAVLRHTMALYGGWQHHLGRDTREGHRRFFHQFGVDVLTAQALGSKDAAELEIRIRATLNKHNVVEATA